MKPYIIFFLERKQILCTTVVTKAKGISSGNILLASNNIVLLIRSGLALFFRHKYENCCGLRAVLVTWPALSQAYGMILLQFSSEISFLRLAQSNDGSQGSLKNFQSDNILCCLHSKQQSISVWNLITSFTEKSQPKFCIAKIEK